MILGDMDSATDEALAAAPSWSSTPTPTARARAPSGCERSASSTIVVPAVGTSQDVAMLLAHEKGAELIVSVGAHFNLIEFLDKNRAGMSSTFLTRLRIGETPGRRQGRQPPLQPGRRAAGTCGAVPGRLASCCIAIVVVSSPALGEFFDLLWLKIKVALGTSDRAYGLLRSLPRRLAGGRLPGAGRRDPDRRRLRLRRRQRRPPTTSSRASPRPR